MAETSDTIDGLHFGATVDTFLTYMLVAGVCQTTSRRPQPPKSSTSTVKTGAEASVNTALVPGGQNAEIAPAPPPETGPKFDKLEAEYQAKMGFSEAAGDNRDFFCGSCRGCYVREKCIDPAIYAPGPFTPTMATQDRCESQGGLWCRPP